MITLSSTICTSKIIAAIYDRTDALHKYVSKMSIGWNTNADSSSCAKTFVKLNTLENQQEKSNWLWTQSLTPTGDT